MKFLYYTTELDGWISTTIGFCLKRYRWIRFTTNIELHEKVLSNPSSLSIKNINKLIKFIIVTLFFVTFPWRYTYEMYLSIKRYERTSQEKINGRCLLFISGKDLRQEQKTF